MSYYDYRSSKVFEPNRPNALDYINCLFDDFIEFHGDRLYGDDTSLIGGIAMFNQLYEHEDINTNNQLL